MEEALAMDYTEENYVKNLPEFKQQLKIFSISELNLVIKKLLISKQEFISGKWSSSSTFMINLILS